MRSPRRDHLGSAHCVSGDAVVSARIDEPSGLTRTSVVVAGCELHGDELAVGARVDLVEPRAMRQPRRVPVVLAIEIGALVDKDR